ncbi:hypothetical protein crov290 [Cafeteria roenbergensis virus]|uniref:Uncharacterized protein n=1 Tax=Cafeteria roenbergensis virus (strain BV-PW1) TaxID=693272 RepID=E3T560_CROVB|nr:hypothetical protein crov290 [Cafeteria roenbergensis virus BV-PW1]ADO67323.1 hypothetical protein crov290 [Cafeteria roenbergensis virus BV-PW1]
MGNKISNSTDTIGFRDTNIDNYSSTLPGNFKISKEINQVINNLPQDLNTNQQGGTINTSEESLGLHEIFKKLEKTNTNTTNNMSDTSPFISSEMYNFLMKGGANKNTKTSKHTPSIKKTIKNKKTSKKTQSTKKPMKNTKKTSKKLGNKSKGGVSSYSKQLEQVKQIDHTLVMNPAENQSHQLQEETSMTIDSSEIKNTANTDYTTPTPIEKGGMDSTESHRSGSSPIGDTPDVSSISGVSSASDIPDPKEEANLEMDDELNYQSSSAHTNNDFDNSDISEASEVTTGLPTQITKGIKNPKSKKIQFNEISSVNTSDIRLITE